MLIPSMRLVALPLMVCALAGAAVAQPVIGIVQDGGANTPDLAPGSIFVIRGTGLSGEGFIQAPGLPLTAELGGVTVSFTPSGGGSPAAAFLVNTFNVGGTNQITALLPSQTPPGDYEARVSFGGEQSAPFAVRVVARKPGIVTANSAGTGPAQATTAANELVRFANGELAGWQLRPLRAGDAAVLWVTGLGADAASDPAGGSSGDITASAGVTVLVDGVEVMPFFAGRVSGIPGLDQVNFFLPDSTRADCAIPVQLRVGGIASNPVTLAVAAPGAEFCASPRFSGDELRRLSLGEEVFQGIFDISSTLIEGHFPGQEFPPQFSEAFIGLIGRMTPNNVVVEGTSLPPGGCTAWRRVSRGDQIQFSNLAFEGLDAGPAIEVSGGPGAPVQASKVGANNQYVGSWPFGGGRLVPPGTYAIAAQGGADVGPFQAEVSMPAFDWTNRGAITSIDRSRDLVINWSGGTPGGVNVTGFGARLISGSLMDPANALVDAVLFSCWQDAGAGTLTVPTSILSQLPAVGPGSVTAGSLGVVAFPGLPGGTRFNAPLVAGGEIPGFLGYINGFSKQLAIQ